MRVARDHLYSVSPEALFGTFTDEAALLAKHKALGSRDIVIHRCQVSPEKAEVDFSREVPAEVPSMFKRFIQPWNAVRQTEHWQHNSVGYHAALSLDIKGVPAAITGTLHIEPVDDGCINHIVLTIECSIPLVGGKLAKFIADDAKRQMRDEYEYLSALLATS
ncbi:MAG: DUF2505 domain-containing protein [Pseudomonadota bacterium]